MREQERKRLVELIKDSLIKHIDKSCLLAENIASDLLDNGVIVPPVKVGEKVHVIDVCSCTHHYERLCTANNKRQKNTKWLAIAKIPPTYSYSRCLKLFERPFKIEYLNKIVKTVFLTREEAEKMLKGGEG